MQLRVCLCVCLCVRLVLHLDQASRFLWAPQNTQWFWWRWAAEFKIESRNLPLPLDLRRFNPKRICIGMVSHWWYSGTCTWCGCRQRGFTPTTPWWCESEWLHVPTVYDYLTTSPGCSRVYKQYRKWMEYQHSILLSRWKQVNVLSTPRICMKYCHGESHHTTQTGLANKRYLEIRLVSARYNTWYRCSPIPHV